MEEKIYKYRRALILSHLFCCFLLKTTTKIIYSFIVILLSSSLDNGAVQNAFNTSSFQNWTTSMNVCFGLHRLPISIGELKGHNSTTPSWTGVITSNVIYSIDGKMFINTSSKEEQ